MDIEFVLSNVYENLKQQFVLHDELLKLANIKKEAIVKNETDQLKDITKQEQQLVFGVIDLEEKREKCVKELAGILNKAQDELTISEIISLSKEKVKDIALLKGMEEIKNDLSKVINELKNINELNNQLIKNSIEYIGFSLNLMLGSTVQSTYGNSGEESDMRAASRGFDKKY